MCLFELRFSLGICPVVVLLGHMLALFLVFLGTSILFYIVATLIYIPTNTTRRLKRTSFVDILGEIIFLRYEDHCVRNMICKKKNSQFLIINNQDRQQNRGR